MENYKNLAFELLDKHICCWGCFLKTYAAGGRRRQIPGFGGEGGVVFLCFYEKGRSTNGSWCFWGQKKGSWTRWKCHKFGQIVWWASGRFL